MVACVRPQLFDTELVDIFMGTLQEMYFENMVDSMSYNFSDVVTIGKRIENGLKTGKILALLISKQWLKNLRAASPKRRKGKQTLL